MDFIWKAVRVIWGYGVLIAMGGFSYKLDYSNQKPVCFCFLSGLEELIERSWIRARAQACFSLRALGQQLWLGALQRQIPFLWVH